MTQPLTETELDAIMTAAGALHPTQRASFEAVVLSELQCLLPDVRGPGTLHRIIAAAQRNYFGNHAIAVGTGKAALRAK